MKRAQAGKRRLALTVIAVSVLAASLLAWGTEYKLSLYHSHERESRQRVPFAKLLSEKERRAAAHQLEAHPEIQASTAAFALLLFLSLSCAPRRRDEIWILRSCPYRPARRAACFFHFSSRPPPAVAC